MRKHLIIYTSDIHGNEVQYKKLVDFAIRKKADSVIIGGDILPKRFKIHKYISGQRRFLEERLPVLLGPFKEQRPGSRIYLMMGNDDCAANHDILDEENGNLYHAIDNSRLKLNEEFEVIGYSFVPITPFGIKDWEKYDLGIIPDDLLREYSYRKKTNYRLKGVKSEKKGARTGFKPFLFDAAMEKEDSMQKDLAKELFVRNPKKTIYVTHSPPNKTFLDQIYGGHVGSFAVREFIEKSQPYLTLHGHIHETVEVSGSFKDRIGKTLCLASGNHDVGSNLAVLVFDLYDPKKVKRLII